MVPAPRTATRLSGFMFFGECSAKGKAKGKWQKANGKSISSQDECARHSMERAEYRARKRPFPLKGGAAFFKLAKILPQDFHSYIQRSYIFVSDSTFSVSPSIFPVTDAFRPFFAPIEVTFPLPV